MSRCVRAKANKAVLTMESANGMVMLLNSRNNNKLRSIERLLKHEGNRQKKNKLEKKKDKERLKLKLNIRPSKRR